MVARPARAPRRDSRPHRSPWGAARCDRVSQSGPAAHRSPILAFVLALLAPWPVAAEGARLSTDEATITLEAGEARPDGTLRGAITIELSPGWHTYWREPGAGGVPPQVSFAASPSLAGEALHLPLPHRFGAGETAGVGYTGRTVFPFELSGAEGTAPEQVSAKVFLGVCRDICIPVDAELAAPAGSGSEAEIAAAFEALPSLWSPEDGQGVVVAREAETLHVVLPPDAVDAFPDLPEGWVLGPPAVSPMNGKTLAYPILSRPDGDAAALGAIDVLVAGSRPGGVRHEGVAVTDRQGERSTRSRTAPQ